MNLWVIILSGGIGFVIGFCLCAVLVANGRGDHASF